MNALVFLLSLVAASHTWASANVSALELQVPSNLLTQSAAAIAGVPRPSQSNPSLPTRTKTGRGVDTRALIRAAARKHGVPAAFVNSIVAAESNFNAGAVSPKGAIGLMQLMPSTAASFGADPRVPEQNVDAGTQYLRVLIDRYHKYRNSIKRVIAAYNAGPAMVDRYHGVPPYRETRVYVSRVLAFMKLFQRERSY
jgi:soluble lytic murein transglycosylase-like protein